MNMFILALCFLSFFGGICIWCHWMLVDYFWPAIAGVVFPCILCVLHYFFEVHQTETVVPRSCITEQIGSDNNSIFFNTRGITGSVGTRQSDHIKAYNECPEQLYVVIKDEVEWYDNNPATNAKKSLEIKLRTLTEDEKNKAKVKRYVHKKILEKYNRSLNSLKKVVIADKKLTIQLPDELQYDHFIYSLLFNSYFSQNKISQTN